MRYSLLIVEDRPAISFALCDYFKRGYDVECASDLSEAEAMLQVRRFTVMIADLSLSRAGSAEGLALTAQVRREWPRTRTIILTAYGTVEAEQAARRLGVDHFLRKPVPLVELGRLVDLLAGPSAEAEVAAS